MDSSGVGSFSLILSHPSTIRHGSDEVELKHHNNAHMRCSCVLRLGATWAAAVLLPGELSRWRVAATHAATVEVMCYDWRPKVL